MKRPRVKPSRKKKWIVRGLFTAGGLLAAAVVTPFIFTSGLIRYYLAHSSYRDVPIRFGSASLSPMGRLTIHDLVIEETGESAGKKLLSAESATISFAWSGVGSHRAETIVLGNVEVALHPGMDTPLTFLRLMSPKPEAVAAGSAAPAAVEAPLWFDQLLVMGKIHVEGYEPWLALSQVHPTDDIPLILRIKPVGNAGQPGWDAAVNLGEEGSKTGPFLSTHFTIMTQGDATTLAFERFSVANISPVVDGQVLKSLPGLPAGLRRAASGHVERLSMAGSLTIGKEINWGGNVEVRDFSGRDETGVMVAEHLSAATRVDGKWTATAGRDIRFTHTQFAWENLEAAGVRLQKGSADAQWDGKEIELTSLQANYADAQVVATGAYDVESGLLSRGRVWLKDFTGGTLMEHLPAAVQKSVPVKIDGKVSARMFLSESDKEHIAAHVELECLDDLTVKGPAFPAMPNGIGGVVSNLNVSGTLSWNYDPGTTPELTHGRLTADDVFISPPTPEGQGLGMSRIRSDFTVVHGAARLDDFYADLPNNGRISAGADYSTSTGTFEDATLSLSGVDLSMANPWLPGGWTLVGQVDAELRGGFTPNDVTLTASGGLASQTMLKSKDGTLTISGPAPALALRMTTDFRTRTAQIELAEMTGIGTIQADGGWIGVLRKWRRPTAGSGLDNIFNAMQTGAFVSFDKIGFTGAARVSGLNGTLSMSGLDVGTEPEKPSLLNLTFKAGVAAEFDDPQMKSLKITDGEFLAEKITLGQSVLTEIGGQVEAGNGKMELSDGKFSLAEGKAEVAAEVTLAGEASALKSLQINFTGIHQQPLMRSLYPDVFTAEGPISGNLSLVNTGMPAALPLAGTLTLAADLPGRLKISRDTSKGTFVPIARAGESTPDAVLPTNFDEIVMDQLADYPYVTGRATLIDDGGGEKGVMSILLDYTREGLKEGEPGYQVPVMVQGQAVLANVEFQLRGALTIHQSIAGVLERMLGGTK